MQIKYRSSILYWNVDALLRLPSLEKVEDPSKKLAQELWDLLITLVYYTTTTMVLNLEIL